MNISVNGESMRVKPAISIDDLIAYLNLTEKKIAVAIDQNIIPVSAYKNTTLQENNEIEIVRAVGGG